MKLNEKLFENKLLTEKFSDSMPKWLKDRMLFTKPTMGRSPNIADQRARYQSKGHDMDSQTRPKFGPRAKTRDSIYSAFTKLGINLDSANFHEDGDIPTSSRDPRLKEPNIPIFLLQGEDIWGDPYNQVYAKGVNDDELFAGDTDKYLKFVPMKTLLANTRAFCYLDTSDAENFGANAKRDDRREMQKELKDQKRYSQEEQNSMWGSKFDKSGYLIDPDRMVKKLDKYYSENYGKLVDKFYNKITNIKRDFAQVLMDTDVKDKNAVSADMRPIFSNYSSDRLMYRLFDVIDSYNYFITSLDAALQEPDEQARKDAVKSTIQSYNKRLTRAIEDLEQRAEKYLSVDLDWD